jgi:hypothetical protein
MTTHEDVTRAPAAAAPGYVRAAAWHLRRAALPLVAVFAFLVHSPVLSTPLFQDDYNQVAMIDGRYPSHPGPLDLYDFINDANRGPLIERGVLPWWSHPHMELRFLRPLSSALLWADHVVFGAGALFQHLHSLFWWSLASVGVFAVLRRMFSRRVATLGALIFAVAPCHGCPLSWIANREELISLGLGTFALLAYLRWRERSQRRDALLAFALSSVAMLAGEYSLCFAGYVLAIELTRGRESLVRRALGVAPFAVPALAYLVARHAMHYGAFGTGYYRDPLRDFGSYAAGVPRRFAVLFTTAWAGVDDRIWINARAWKLALLLAVIVALVVIPVRSLLRELEGLERKRAIWLLAGSVFSIAPIMAVGPSVRLLEIPMLGVSGGVALILDHAWFPRRPQPRHGAAEWTALCALSLAFVHLVRAPLDSWLAHRELRQMAYNFEHEMTWMHEHAEGKSMVLILRANWFQTLFVAPLMVEGTTPVRSLSFDSGRFLLLRTAPNAIELVSGSVPLFPVDAEDLVRKPDVPLHVDDTVELSGMRATIAALRDQGAPRRLRFEFDRDLDDPSFLWVVEKGVKFEEQKLPASGFGEPIKN